MTLSVLIIMVGNKSRLVTNSHCVYSKVGTSISGVRLFPIFRDNTAYTALVFVQFNDSVIQNVRRKRQNGLKRHNNGANLLPGAMRCMLLQCELILGVKAVGQTTYSM
jgi:hypothetical protein